MTTTTNLSLPTWDEGNTEPNLVFNQLLAASDALIQCVVQAITATPPVSPTLGWGWIVDASPTGDWVGHTGEIAVAVTGGWVYYLPENGWAAFVVSEAEDYQLVAGAWAPRSNGGGGMTNPMTAVGDMIIGGTAGAPTRLAAATAGFILTAAGAATAPAWGSNTALKVSYDHTSSGLTATTVQAGIDELKTLIGAISAPSQSIVAACSDETTALTSGTAKVTFRNPYASAFTVTAVKASLTTAQTSGSIFTVDINESGTTILSTKLTIDNTEKTSATAATPPVISDTSIAADAEITVDIDQIGDGTAKGLKIYLIGHL